MTATDLAFLTIADLTAAFARGEVSSHEVTEAQLARIDAHDEALNAYITIMRDQALAAADRADARRRTGERGSLLGVPLAVKDLFATAGIRTTAGARILADSVPSVTATAVRHARRCRSRHPRQDEHDGVCLRLPTPLTLARAATRGTPNEPPAGRAAAQRQRSRQGLAYGALGSDTGGSIRSPAAYCGITGLKPTYGRVGRHGVIPLAWSLDHCGPLTRTAYDTALIFDAIAGYDPRDPASATEPFVATAPEIERSVSGLRIGVVGAFFELHVEPPVREVAEAAMAPWSDLGVELVPLELECVPMVGPTIMPLVQAEATAYHWQTLLERPDDYGPDIRDNLRLGATVLAKDYIQAQRLRRQMQVEIDAALRTVDALIFPTQPIVAPVARHLSCHRAGRGGRTRRARSVIRVSRT